MLPPSFLISCWEECAKQGFRLRLTGIIKMSCNYYLRYPGSTMSTQASTRQCMFHLEFYVENHPFHSPLLTPGGHTTTWYFKYGKACLQLAERILERMPKSDSHSAVWRNVIKALLLSTDTSGNQSLIRVPGQVHHSISSKWQWTWLFQWIPWTSVACNCPQTQWNTE